MDHWNMQRDMDKIRQRQQRESVNPPSTTESPTTGGDNDALIREVGVQVMNPMELPQMRRSLEIAYPPQEVEAILRRYELYCLGEMGAEEAPGGPGFCSQAWQWFKYVIVGVFRIIINVLRLLTDRCR